MAPSTLESPSPRFKATRRDCGCVRRRTTLSPAFRFSNQRSKELLVSSICATLRPDVVLTDLSSPEMGSVEPRLTSASRGSQAADLHSRTSPIEGMTPGRTGISLYLEQGM